MKFNITRKSNVKESFRVQSVVGQFDLQSTQPIEKFTGDIPIEGKEWSVGAIIGSSGTGKSTIGFECFGEHLVQGFKWGRGSLLDDMPKAQSTKEITKILNAVGFSSPPSWIKPFEVLSNGEKMRVELARAILEKKDMFVFDEFTSVVDRQVARVGSYAIAKAVRKLNKQFVAISCHHDILEWLEPDWVFDTNEMSFFLTQNINAQDWKLKSKSVKEICGTSLGNITI